MRVFPLFLLLALACGGASQAPTPGSTGTPGTTGGTTVTTTTTTTTTTPAGPPAPTRKPNLVYILVDDLDLGTFALTTGLAPLLQDEGTTFDRAYISNSICCPSRASMLRGQYGHNTGVMHTLGPNGGFRGFHRNCESSTAATWIHDQGYATALLGKYFNGYPFKDELSFVPPGWDEWAVPAVGDGYGSYNYTLNHNGTMEAHGDAPEDHITDVLTGHALDFIRTQSAADKPFFLWLALYAPHLPATPPPRHEGALTGQAPRTMGWNEEDMSDKPTFQQSNALMTPAWVKGLDEVWRYRKASMLGVVDAVNQVIETLKQTNQLDNTWIVFMSDNGYHLGQHRLPWGKDTAYEEDIHVPLVVRGPGVPRGAHTDRMVLNTDIGPTFADITGATTPDFVDGRSWRPVALGQIPTTWRHAVLLEHQQAGSLGNADSGPDKGGQGGHGPPAGRPRPGGPGQGGQGGPGGRPGGARPGGPRGGQLQGQSEAGVPDRFVLAEHGNDFPDYRGLRTERYTYVRYVDGSKELYDNAKDPDQVVNLAASADPALLAEIERELQALETCKGATCRSGEDAVQH